MGILLMVVLIGIAVAGLAAVVAIWVERDVRRPRKFAWALSVLILLATGVTILQSVLQDQQEKIDKAADEAEKEKLRGDMARMMQTLDRIASESGDPRLQQFLSTEIEAQSRANPEVVQKLAQRYADEGENPAEKLAKHLPKSEVQKMARAGSIKTEPKAVKIERKRGAPAVETPRPPRPATVAPAGGAAGEASGEAAGEAALEVPRAGRGGAPVADVPAADAPAAVKGAKPTDAKPAADVKKPVPVVPKAGKKKKPAATSDR